MSGSEGEGDRERHDVRDLLLIMIGIFISFGLQSFSEGLKAATYPQLFPAGVPLANYIETQGLLFFASFLLAAILVLRLPSFRLEGRKQFEGRKNEAIDKGLRG